MSLGLASALSVSLDLCLPKFWPRGGKAMLADPKINVEDVARRLSVSSATLYRHMPAPRTTYSGLPA
jgi:hypothetical protein